MGTLIHRILAPTDFSPHSERAMTYATKLARELGAELVLVHVVEMPLYGSPFPAPPMTDVGIEFEKIARQTLDTAAKLIRDNGQKAEVIVEQGSAWRKIIDAATTTGADLIVMATHGRHGLSRALIGSVAEKVVRSSPVPVLTVSVKESETAKTL